MVTLQTTQHFRYPTPYELHFSNQSPEPPTLTPPTSTETDPDLAAHFTITRERGVCLWGRPISAVFGAVPAAAYLDSIVSDNRGSMRNIAAGPDHGTCKVPTYAVLNACRVLAYWRHGAITSKAEGGDWGLRELPDTYQPVLEQAAKEYTSPGTSTPVDAGLLKNFGRYVSAELML